MHFILLCITMKYLLVFVYAEPVNIELKMVYTLIDSFFENMFNAVTKNVMKANHFKELLKTHKMEHFSQDPSFYYKLKNILYLYDIFYFEEDPRPSTILAYEFLGIEIEKHGPVIQIDALSDKFRTFLEQNPVPATTECISKNSKSQIKPSTSQVEVARTDRKGKCNEQIFFEDLFHELDKDKGRWYGKIYSRINNYYSTARAYIKILSAYNQVYDVYKGHQT